MNEHPWTSRPHQNNNAESNAIVFDQVRKGDIKNALNFVQLIAIFPWALTKRVMNILSGIGRMATR